MTAVALEAFPVFYDDDGNPLSGGKVFTYEAGTSTPQETFTDRTAAVLNSNPIILDTAGRADIWLLPNEPYRIVVKNADESEVIRDVDDFYAGADPAQLTIAGIVPSTGGTYSGLVSFSGGAAFDGTPAQDLATLDSLNIAAVQNANLWINPDFAINQRASTAASDGTYGFDRTVHVCETGGVNLSQLTQPLDGVPFAMRMTQPDATPKRMGFLQIVEARNCLAFRGRNLVLALKVRCSAATTIRCALVSWGGTQDAPTRDVVNNWASTTYTAGNFFVANTSTIAVAAQAVNASTWTDMVVSSASPGGVVVPSTLNNLYMVVWTDAAQTQNVTLDASVVRCGQGTVAPLWTPPNAQQELAKCKRYLPAFAGTNIGQVIAPGQCTSTTTALIYFALDVQPRVFPTGVVSAGAAYLLNSGGGATGNLTNFVYTTAGPNIVVCTASVLSGLVAGDATALGANASNNLVYFTGCEL